MLPTLLHGEEPPTGALRFGDTMWGSINKPEHTRVRTQTLASPLLAMRHGHTLANMDGGRSAMIERREESRASLAQP